MLFDGHNGFITISYAATLIVFLIAILWVIFDGKKLKSALKVISKDEANNGN